MRLTADEEAILAGRRGEPVRRALEMQVATGEFFGAERLVPAYGMHLDECRWGTHLVEVRDQPRGVSDWGALGVFVGRRLTNYWLVPVFTGLEVEPDSDGLKQLGATASGPS